MASTIRQSSTIQGDTIMAGSRVVLRDLGTTQPQRYSCDLFDPATGAYGSSLRSDSFSRAVAVFHERCTEWKVSSGGAA